MIIVSQDRLSVINFNNIVLLDGNVDEHPQELIAAFGNDQGVPIGKFKDDERLKEVLDEFRKAYFDGKPTFYVPKE